MIEERLDRLEKLVVDQHMHIIYLLFCIIKSSFEVDEEALFEQLDALQESLDEDDR